MQFYFNIFQACISFPTKGIHIHNSRVIYPLNASCLSEPLNGNPIRFLMLFFLSYAKNATQLISAYVATCPLARPKQTQHTLWHLLGKSCFMKHYRFRQWRAWSCTLVNARGLTLVLKVSASCLVSTSGTISCLTGPSALQCLGKRVSIRPVNRIPETI